MAVNFPVIAYTPTARHGRRAGRGGARDGSRMHVLAFTNISTCSLNPSAVPVLNLNLSTVSVLYISLNPEPCTVSVPQS
ncbi:hypothetical protein E2C01_069567 [Portunus trituberculatus]|uniref:Uncharacterized protein n=1 Tax=Portunus trituberculatus TaxID=210409 RepID=A0A5B7HYW1_PORTR|nr:hypothetical protein [Portunus trituberculatus]